VAPSAIVTECVGAASQAEAKGEPVTDLVRGIVDDFRTLFGLPGLIVDALDADAKALGLDRRQYLMHLVARRYEDSLAHGPGFERKGGAKPRTV
jgi:hypothetical protein